MIKTTRYCDICSREIHKNYDKFFQLILPERDINDEIILSDKEQDVCKECFKKIYWAISELKYPNRKCPD